MITLEELAKTCLKKGIRISEVTIDTNDNFVFEVEGFSKSGSAKLYLDDGKIKCETRYGQIDDIEDFRDLAYVAFGWNKLSHDYGYCHGWSSDWAPVFVEYGWLKKQERTVTDYTLN